MLLTFARLPNDYIISFIPQNTNKTQKKSIGEIAISARSRSERSALRAITINAFARCVDRDRAKIEAEIAIGATAPADDVGGAMRRSRSQSALPRQPVMSADGDVALSLSLSLSLFQDRKYFEVKIETENHFRCFGSQIRSTGNAFQFDRI